MRPGKAASCASQQASKVRPREELSIAARSRHSSRAGREFGAGRGSPADREPGRRHKHTHRTRAAAALVARRPLHQSAARARIPARLGGGQESEGTHVGAVRSDVLLVVRLHVVVLGSDVAVARQYAVARHTRERGNECQCKARAGPPRARCPPRAAALRRPHCGTRACVRRHRARQRPQHAPVEASKLARARHHELLVGAGPHGRQRSEAAHQEQHPPGRRQRAHAAPDSTHRALHAARRSRRGAPATRGFTTTARAAGAPSRAPPPPYRIMAALGLWPVCSWGEQKPRFPSIFNFIGRIAKCRTERPGQRCW